MNPNDGTTPELEATEQVPFDELLSPAEDHEAEEEIFFCQECGQGFPVNEDYGDGRIHLCEHCRDAFYYTCERCGRLIHEDEVHYHCDEPYCSDCYSQVARNAIYNYSYKPEPSFYGDGTRFFGVELEIDDGGHLHRNAKALLAIANEHAPHLYCKEDGSLRNGFELVSEPMTLDYHAESMPWEAICNKAIQLGYHSHQAGSCGLHVHVNRNSFGDTPAAQEAAIGRILFFVEKHWNKLLKFSRRTPAQLERWARRYGYKDHPELMIETVKKGEFGRYTCVNLTNYATIEFRMWRGTLKYNTFIATLQMVARICNLATTCSDDEVKALSWNDFVAHIEEPELIAYLKERDLYLNDPVESEVEI